jgi:hypothetical protein
VIKNETEPHRGAPLAGESELVERSFFKRGHVREFAVFGFAPWPADRW